jgi:hypothetical protein
MGLLVLLPSNDPDLLHSAVDAGGAGGVADRVDVRAILAQKAAWPPEPDGPWLRRVPLLPLRPHRCTLHHLPRVRREAEGASHGDSAGVDVAACQREPMKKATMSAPGFRFHLRRWSSIVAVAGIALWLGTMLFDVYLFGDSVSLYYGCGCVGIYWSGDPVTRNSRLLNGFDWPWFDGGAGTTWEAAGWGRVMVDGPRRMLSWDTVSNRVHYPQHLGLYLPGQSFTDDVHHLGLPFWVLIVAGLSGRVLSRRKPKSGDCPSCGYNLSGNITGLCPECGGTR